jgi:hypothetical protein
MFIEQGDGFFVANPKRLEELENQENMPIRIGTLEQENEDLKEENTALKERLIQVEQIIDTMLGGTQE